MSLPCSRFSTGRPRGSEGARPGLAFSVFEEPAKAARLAHLLEIVRASPGTGIVYCLTIPETRRVADFLKKEGVRAREYHAKLKDEDRVEVEAELRDSDVEVVVATSALGMGFDKPDIEFVVHFQSPSSIVEYYQQAGRAGRGIPKARAVLMVGEGDEGVHTYFSSIAFVTEHEAERVLKAIRERGRATMAQLESSINIESERIEKAVRLLDVEGAIQKSGFNWVIADPHWTYDESRPERVTAQRRLERQAMYAYAASRRCRVETLMDLLDDPDPSECGECDNCRGEHEGEAAPALVTTADTFLARFKISIAPKQWAPATSRNRPYPIPRHAWGRALCFLGEGEAGRLADEAITHHLPFDDSIVEASVELIKEWRFKAGQEPAWVSFIPKDEDGEFLHDFAERVAKEIGKPFRAGLKKARETRSQLELCNDVQRYENLSFAFEPTSKVRPEPVLLIDDMVYSGWTFAVAAMTLRKQGGVEAVVPFAVARVL